MITLLHDGTIEVIDGPLERVTGPGRELVPGWTRYGDGPCEVWRQLAGTALNLDATTLYYLAHGADRADITPFYLYGAVAIVQPEGLLKGASQ